MSSWDGAASGADSVSSWDGAASRANFASSWDGAASGADSAADLRMPAVVWCKSPCGEMATRFVTDVLLLLLQSKIWVLY